MKGQLSAEMLIVLVIVLGLAIFLASTMYKSATNTGQAIENKTNNITNGGINAKGCVGAACNAPISGSVPVSRLIA